MRYDGPAVNERLRIRPLRLLVSWLVSAAALIFAAAIVPGVGIEGWAGAIVAAALIAILNAMLPPLVAALRLPYTLVLGLLLVLVLDALDVHDRGRDRCRTRSRSTTSAGRCSRRSSRRRRASSSTSSSARTTTTRTRCA